MWLYFTVTSASTAPGTHARFTLWISVAGGGEGSEAT